jgi:hypothetical protein
MALQAGNTSEARSWYTRLLEADPKDTAVIALVSEIDAAADATPVETPEIPGVDADAGDQEIPALDISSELVFLSEPASSAAESEPADQPAQGSASSADSPAGQESAANTSAAGASSSAEPSGASQADKPSSQDSSSTSRASDDVPLGLERHYPVQEASPPEPPAREAQASQSSSAERVGEEPPAAESPAQGSSIEGPRVEDLGVTVGNSAADGLKSVIPEAVSPLDWSGPPPSAAAEAAAPPAAPEAEPFTNAAASAAEPPVRKPEPRAPRPAEPARAPEAKPPAPESPTRSEDRTFSGASSEPFVNETMAQLYLQQGYKQLALQVYRQLAVSRPQDEGLRNRIAEIEAADAAEHPGEVPARKAPPVAKPSAPEDTGPRQPSIREFFATLGRRRPPAPSSRGRSSSGSSGNNQSASVDMRPPPGAAPLGAAPPGANLDSVFAGATVSQADARAASRLAGAFSGTSGSSRTSPPTPPMPTPRVNPRVPQTQESEEDVAKFRAWLDGLTGE